jgi:hypothetical protein
MLWSELLAALDAARSQIRGARKLKEIVPSEDPILEELFNALTGELTPPAVIDPAVIEAVEPKVPQASTPIVVEAVERGAGEGRMLVFARDTPHIVRKPVLEEVFDEKDLG